ncbi:MAG: 16S rRNA (cytosine(967)-C(5))-methyltransferase RsmB [Gammaproteobacteria bacterium]|nr:16S rRNA (cytosine(967)-C(5))-methyltransferase RsmB [Gammaproteobacteria bacterium]
MDARTVAVRVLTQVFGARRSLNDALAAALSSLSRPTDRALAQELCYGVLRCHPRLEKIARRLLHHPLKRRDADVLSLMMIGLYQLAYLRVPAYAAIDATVEAARALGKPWAAGLTNAVLRGFQRDAARLLAEVDTDAEARHALPAWLLEDIKTDWPDDWRAIAQASAAHPPMSLRVNTRRLSRADYLQRLRDAGMGAREALHTTTGLVLDAPLEVERLPGFAEGWVSVQDAAAQLAAPLIGLAPGQRVLDACAAPGGKTCHILETEPGVRLLALDVDRERLTRVRDNLKRLALHAELIAADAARPHAWWDGTPFDRILLDAPCSAIGVLRRHPDIKVLRGARDVETLATGQQRLLDALWPLLARGGMLLYATCSILAVENARRVAGFLAGHDDARERPIDAAWGHSCAHGRQILPGEDGMDGFYYACLTKAIE